jgi:hypothetical protein
MLSIFKKVFVICALLFSFLVFETNVSYAGKCSGTASCSACKSCANCKHCGKEGGTCGACTVEVPKVKTKKEKKSKVEKQIIDSTNTEKK